MLIKIFNKKIFLGNIIKIKKFKYPEILTKNKHANINLSIKSKCYKMCNKNVNAETTVINIVKQSAYYSEKNRFLFDASGYRISKCISSCRMEGVPDKIIINSKVSVFEEPVLYVGDFEMFHYGHFLIEGLAHIWPTFKNKNIKFFYLGTPWWIKDYRLRKKYAFIDEFMNSLGTNKNNFFFSDVDLLFKNIYIPDPSFILNTQVNIEHRKIFEKSFRHFFPKKMKSRKGAAYLSRSKFYSGNRRIVGEEKLVDILKSHGFEIIYPETLSLKEQIKIFNSFKCIAACFGSAIHTQLFSFNPGLNMFVITAEKTHINTAKIVDKITCTQSYYIKTLKNINDFCENDYLTDKILDLDETIQQLKYLGAI